ncbi:MAG: iron-containing alcohol dehydrogenase [Planctomycetia bacterium]|nr:iron-containing alcohol dehydrogenase [Planctomycetia bacterium]
MIPLLPAELRTPATVRFGSGCVEQIPGMVRSWCGRRAWLIAGSRRFAQPGGLIERLCSLLNAGGLDARLLTTISREPAIEDVDRAVTQLLHLREACGTKGGVPEMDLVVGVGGGAAIDLAKAVAAMVPQPCETGMVRRSVRDYLEGIGTGAELTESPLPVIAIPTTSGTGAEATKNAVISCPPLPSPSPFPSSLRCPSRLSGTGTIPELRDERCSPETGRPGPEDTERRSPREMSGQVKNPGDSTPMTAYQTSQISRNGCKKSLRHPAMVPVLAVIDPDLTATLPPERIAGSGMDAITQLIESAISCRANLFIRSLATAALPGALEALPRLYETARSGTPSDPDVLRRAREAMAYAAFVSGVTLANSGLGLAHGVAAALGVHADVPHGVACALMLPTALRVNRTFLRDALGHVVDTATLETRITDLNRQLGIPERLSQVGVTAEMISSLARDSRGNSLSGNPVSLTESDLIALLTERL